MFFQRPKRTFIAGTMIIGASITALISLGSFFYCWHFVRTALRANGQVIQLVERRDRDDGKLYAPVFTFRDSENVEHTVTSSTSSYPPEHQVGESVRVFYVLNDPKNAKIDSFFSLWGVPLITGLLTTFYLPLGLIIWNWPRIVQKFRHKPPVIPTAQKI